MKNSMTGGHTTEGRCDLIPVLLRGTLSGTFTLVLLNPSHQIPWSLTKLDVFEY